MKRKVSKKLNTPNPEEVAKIMRLAMEKKLEVSAESRKLLDKKVKSLFERGLITSEQRDRYSNLTKMRAREV